MRSHIRVQRTRSTGRGSPSRSICRRRCKIPMLLIPGASGCSGAAPGWASGRVLIRNGDAAGLREGLIDRGGMVDQRRLQAVGNEDTLDVAGRTRKPKRDTLLLRLVGKSLDHVGTGRVEEGHG